MFSLRFDQLVSTIVNQELVGKGRDKEVLYINFDCRIAYYTNEKSYNQSRGLHLIYGCRPGYSYVDVFSGVTESPFGSIREVESWKHETSHSSCWRDIKVFSSLYFEMAELINAERAKDGLKPVAPIKMSEHNSFRNHNRLFDWVPAIVETDPLDEYRYKRILKLI